MIVFGVDVGKTAYDRLIVESCFLNLTHDRMLMNDSDTCRRKMLRVVSGSLGY